MQDVGKNKYEFFSAVQRIPVYLISNFRRVLNVFCFLPGNSPVSEFYMPTFRNTLFHLHRQMSVHLSAYEDWTDRVFRNVGISNSDVGELPRRKHKNFQFSSYFRLFPNFNVTCSLWFPVGSSFQYTLSFISKWFRVALMVLELRNQFHS